MQPNAIHEWIGNKIVILHSGNSKLSNKKFSDKKNIIDRENYRTIPHFNYDNESSVKIEDSEDWTHKEIMKRSIHICDVIFNKIYFENNNWFDLDS